MEYVDNKICNYVKQRLLRITVGVTAIMLVMSLLSSCTIGRTKHMVDFKYSRGANARMIIIKYIGKGGDVVIPSKIGAPVASIDEGAFSGCKNMTSVKIPNSIIIINDHSFSTCTGLTSIILPNSIHKVWDNAFSGCKNLHSVYFEGAAPELGKNVFAGTPSDFTIYYHAGKEGWSNNWNGYYTATY